MAPFFLLRGLAPILFVCDHAASALPLRYGALGLAPELLQTHIAYDIGAAALTRALAARFEAGAVLAVWSRLLIDLNRGADDPTLVMKLSDGSIIAGNRAVDDAEIAHRIAQFHAPYHAAIEEEIARLRSLPRARNSALAGEVAVAASSCEGRRGNEIPRARDSALAGEVAVAASSCEGRRGNEIPRAPTLISVHSFTPVWKGRARPWDIGILWDKDGRLAKPLLRVLREAGFTVGDNEPYSGALENDCLNRHGTKNGLPHVLIEVRQDHLRADAAVLAFADRLTPLLKAALREMHENHETGAQKIHS